MGTGAVLTEIDASYFYVRRGVVIERQLTLSPGVILDLDAEDRLVGIETISTVLDTAMFLALQAARFPRP